MSQNGFRCPFVATSGTRWDARDPLGQKVHTSVSKVPPTHVGLQGCIASAFLSGPLYPAGESPHQSGKLLRVGTPGLPNRYRMDGLAGENEVDTAMQERHAQDPVVRTHKGKGGGEWQTQEEQDPGGMRQVRLEIQGHRCKAHLRS